MIRPTLEEKEALRGLKENTHFLRYLEKVINYTCDIRNGEYSDEARNLAYRTLKESLLDQIRLDNPIENKGKVDESSFGIGEME